MNHFTRTEKVILKDGLLKRVITAHNKGNHLDVAIIDENGKQLTRNIDYFGPGGWLCAFPGEKYKGYSGETYIADIDEWREFNCDVSNLCWSEPSANDENRILTKYPELKWVMAKTDYSTAAIFKIIPLWKKNRKLCETLCSMGLQSLALNGSLYKANDPWSIVKWISRHMDVSSYPLADIRLMMSGATPEQVDSYRCTVHRYNYVTFDEWKYLFDKNLGPSYYNDYRRMCNEVGHDFRDPYWHYPKDLKKAHDKVMREVEKKRKADEAIRRAEARKAEAEKKKAKKDKYDRFPALMAKLARKTMEMDGISVFIPQTIADVRLQATKLHQCLLTADYVSRVVDGKCLLVFVRKAGAPLATAELIKNGKEYRLGQFYGNERRTNYHATEEAKSALMKWAKATRTRIAA